MSECGMQLRAQVLNWLLGGDRRIPLVSSLGSSPHLLLRGWSPYDS